MRGLYAIVDLGSLAACGLAPLPFAEAVLATRPVALQLRAKDAPAREMLALLRELAMLCHRAGVPLVANDRPDLASLAGCDGVHLGQSDMPVERARRLAPGVRVGLSTHDPEQLGVALAANPAYVAYGPVFETSTKLNPDPVVGVAGLRAAHARALAAGIPLVAVGGITLARARGLVGSTDAVAVISELLPPAPVSGDGSERVRALAGVADRARALHALFAPAPAAVEVCP
jgi:thiamine-phosphate pyrophosphorylase